MCIRDRFNVILSAVPVERSAEAAGLSSTSSQFATALGTAAAGAVIALSLGGDIADDDRFDRAEQTSALRLALIAPLAIPALAVGIALRLPAHAGIADAAPAGPPDPEDQVPKPAGPETPT